MNKTQSRLLIVALVVMVLLNIGTLATLWMHHPEHGGFSPHDHNMHHGPHGPPDPGDFIADKLHFNEQQQQQFEKLRDAHADSVHKFENENRELRKKFFDLLKSDYVNPAEADSLATAIGNHQKEIEMATFQHFNSLKNICNADQKKKFDDFLDDLMHMMRPPPPPHNF
ncbi:MAG TPA: periplasmic heavy metal sensor [Chitinophagales bacterium]|nr:periplasmic heavy metal sensor [Chitinophagales bacterium]